MKIHFIVTTSLITDNYESRKEEYMRGINSLFNSLNNYSSSANCSVIIVENNGRRNTFLNELYPQAKIFYTSNNKLSVNKGIKELRDIYDTIVHYEIPDEDMIVKLTGRYIINKNSCFIRELMSSTTKYDCMVKLGSIIDYRNKVSLLDKFDCYTGLFALRSKYLKKDIPTYLSNYKDFEWIEWIIISIIHTNVPNNKILFMDKLDLIVKPAGQTQSNLV
jgi:hypothetical protein